MSWALPGMEASEYSPKRLKLCRKIILFPKAMKSTVLIKLIQKLVFPLAFLVKNLKTLEFQKFFEFCPTAQNFPRVFVLFNNSRNLINQKLTHFATFLQLLAQRFRIKSHFGWNFSFLIIYGFL